MNSVQISEKRSLARRFKLFFKSEYFRNKTNLWLLVLSLAANISNWAALGIFIRPTTSKIILHYNVYFGVDAMGDWKSVFVLPAIGFLLFFINFFLSRHFYHNDERMASYILLATAFMIQISLLIAAMSVIIINY